MDGILTNKSLIMKTMNCVFFRLTGLTVVFLLLSIFISRGQDVIMKKNGDEIKAKVEQVSDKEIKYRKAENVAGPLYTISRSEVFMVKYANGTKDVFNDPQARAVMPAQAVPVAKSKITNSDIKPAESGSLFNYILVAPIMGLGTISALSEDDNAITFGAMATAVGGIGIPIGALTTAKTRRLTGINGNSDLRMWGWITYGLSMADALAMLALSEDVDFTGGPTISVALLATLSTVLFAIDGRQTVAEARKAQSGAAIYPMIGNFRDLAGIRHHTVGITIRF